MRILTSATENSLVALLTYHPTTTTVLMVIGMVSIISAAIMATSVLLRKKFTVPRSPENWDKAEVFIMSMFLHVWYLWACEQENTPSFAKFSEDDELDVAFDKYVKELLHSGAIDKHWHGEDLMQELYCHAGLNSKHPFGQDDTQSVRLNKKRVQFALHYAEKLRGLFIDMA